MFRKRTTIIMLLLIVLGIGAYTIGKSSIFTTATGTQKVCRISKETFGTTSLADCQDFIKLLNAHQNEMIISEIEKGKLIPIGLGTPITIIKTQNIENMSVSYVNIDNGPQKGNQYFVLDTCIKKP